jgi:hypothetical protein
MIGIPPSACPSTTDEQKYPSSLSLLVYGGPGGLRQDPGPALESMTSARSCGRGQNLQKAAEEWDAPIATGLMPTEGGYDRACGDRRRRSDGDDIGGGAHVGGVDVAIVERRGIAEVIGSPGLACGWSAHPHHRGSRPAWDRRSFPRAGPGDVGRGFANVPNCQRR